MIHALIAWHFSRNFSLESFLYTLNQDLIFYSNYIDDFMKGTAYKSYLS